MSLDRMDPVSKMKRKGGDMSLDRMDPVSKMKRKGVMSRRNILAFHYIKIGGFSIPSTNQLRKSRSNCCVCETLPQSFWVGLM
jgi:hypothetical protein